MKVKYIGKSCTDLKNGKIYEYLGMEYNHYRVIDDSNEDYLYPTWEFELIEENES